MKLTFKNKFTEAGDVVSFVFSAPRGTTWQAGQYIRLELKKGEWIDERYFTVASAPYEKQIQITTRLTGSEFKNQLNQLRPEDSATAYGPDGDFTWRETDRPRAMIAAGIGITPFHAILKQRYRDGLSMAVTLLYFNRDAEIPFQAEIDHWQLEHPEFNVAYLTEQRVSPRLISQHLPRLAESLIYLSGPEPVVEEVGEKLIRQHSLQPDQMIRDYFPGYTTI